jgi:hypothetical protein
MATLRDRWHARQGTVRREGGCRDRATAPIEDIQREKIRGCSHREPARLTQCPLCADSDELPQRSEMTRRGQ